MTLEDMPPMVWKVASFLLPKVASIIGLPRRVPVRVRATPRGRPDDWGLCTLAPAPRLAACIT
jgi:hypothetical protein